MEEFIYNQLTLYRELTINLIDAVNFGDTELVLDLLEERQTIINELQGSDKSIINECLKKIDILKMDVVLESLMKNKIKEIYESIKNVKIEKKSVKAYTNSKTDEYSSFTYKV